MKSLFVLTSELKLGDEFVLPGDGRAGTGKPPSRTPSWFEHIEVLRAPAPCAPPPFLTDRDRPHIGMLVKYEGQDKPFEQTFYADLKVLVTYREPVTIEESDELLETVVHTVDHGERPGLSRWSAHIRVSDRAPGQHRYYDWDERADTEIDALKKLTVCMGRAFLRETWRKGPEPV
jgi:hypothetical protein